MSDMIINDSVPVDKKWNELIKYNIFVMKLIEFGISFVIIIIPLIIQKPRGHMYCIASGPTFVISFMFIVLYLRRKVPLFMEKMYLFFQILFTFGALLQCFLLNLVQVWLWLIYGVFYFALLTALVVAMILMSLPFVLKETEVFHCLASAPTLVLSVMFIVLYLVDQVHDVAEQLFLIFQMALTIVAFIGIFLRPSQSGALYGLFYGHQALGLGIDMYYVFNERGFTLFD